MAANITAEKIASQITELRGRKVILAAELARLYGVSTKRLNEQIKRNLSRFPDDFAFRLTEAERDSLRSQIATSKDEGVIEPYRGRSRSMVSSKLRIS